MPSPPEDLLAIRAWFAAPRRDLRAERQALKQLVAVAPGRLAALDRLAGLAKQAGDEAEAARLRKRKAELDQVLERYRERLFKPDPAAAAEELAGHAESLGRLFEARAWWELAVASQPTLQARQRRSPGAPGAGRGRSPGRGDARRAARRPRPCHRAGPRPASRSLDRPGPRLR